MNNPSTSRRRSSISFRSALTLTVATVLLAVIGMLGVVSYINAESIVDDLAYQALDQTAARVHDRLHDLVDQASHAGRTSAERLGRKAWTSQDGPHLVQEFHDAILMNPTLSYLSVGLETGDYAHVYRRSDGGLEGRIFVWKPGPVNQRLDYTFTDGRLDPTTEKRADDPYDPRKRGWFQRAKEAGTQTWPPVYLFMNPPNPDYPGLTCATPVFNPAGEFQGVTTADFDLIALGRFLRELKVLKGGRAFVVEIGADGTHRVVAHPDASAILGKREIDGVLKEDIFPLEEVRDAGVRELVGHMRTTAPADRLRITDVAAADSRYLGGYLRLRSDHDLRWAIGLLVPREALLAPVERSAQRALWIGIAGLLLASLLAWIIARGIARPLERLAADTQAVARFELAPGTEDPSRFTEVRRLSGAMEEMKSGLRSFGRYVPKELVRDVLSSGQDVVLGGERRVLTVGFSDIADFTSVTESLSPEDLVLWLGHYFEVVSDCVADSAGTVDKYIGDSVMAFWGAPQPVENHGGQACEGVLRAVEGIEVLRNRFESESRPSMRARFGLATGELIVGNIGSSRRLNYTAIGDAVNLASRLEELNKMYGTSVLIDDATRRAAGPQMITRPVERVAVKGKSEATLVHELLGRASDLNDATRHLAGATQKALKLYERGEFLAAAKAYEAVLAEHPADGVAFVMAQRCQEHRRTPPTAEWDGVRRLDQK